MPLFIFISGYFHRNERIVQEILYYLVLGVLLRILVFAVDNLILGNPGFLSFVNADGCAWYLFAMAAYTGIACLLRRQNPWLVLVLSLLLGLFAGYDPDIGDSFI